MRSGGGLRSHALRDDADTRALGVSGISSWDEALDPTIDTATVPVTDAASGAFLGIPYGWPLALAIVLAILLMWVARAPMRRLIWTACFVAGRMFSRWGFWLVDHGRNARLVTAEKIASQRADEMAERMAVLRERVNRQVEPLSKQTNDIIVRLDTAGHALEGAASDLSGVNVEEVAERALRSSMLKIDEGRGLSKIEKNTATAASKGLREQLAAVRPALTTLKTQTPIIVNAAEKLSDVEKRFNQGAKTVNETMLAYAEALNSEDRIKVAGRHSIVIPWILALLITMIALSGVFLNFFLIERPMAEIVGEGAKIGGIGLPVFAAMIVIFLEFVAGVVLMDAAGFTKLIPAFQTMSDRSRTIMFWVAFLFLASFSFLEAALAIVREQLIEADQQTREMALGMFGQPAAEGAAAGAAVPAEEPRQGMQLITMAQIILAVLIPWLLATAALPLETIIRNSVFILQMLGAGLMLAGGFVFKTIAQAFRSIGMLILTLYDLIIFAPLWAERRFKASRGEVMPPASFEEDRSIPRRKRERPETAEPAAGLELQKAS